MILSSGSGGVLGTWRRNLNRQSPLAFPARLLKNAAAVSTTPTFFGDGYGYPLVQGDAVFFSKALSGLFHGMGKLNG